MIVQVFCYSAAILVIGSYVGTLKPTASIVINAFLPFSTGCYWLASSYIALCLFSPALNLTIKSMTREQHFAFIVVLLFLFSFIPSIFIFADAWNAAKGHSLVWFITLYVIAAYLKLYKQQTTNNKQQTTNNKQQTTNNKQQTTNNKQYAFVFICLVR